MILIMIIISINALSLALYHFSQIFQHIIYIPYLQNKIMQLILLACFYGIEEYTCF